MVKKNHTKRNLVVGAVLILVLVGFIYLSNIQETYLDDGYDFLWTTSAVEYDGVEGEPIFSSENWITHEGNMYLEEESNPTVSFVPFSGIMGFYMGEIVSGEVELNVDIWNWETSAWEDAHDGTTVINKDGGVGHYFNLPAYGVGDQFFIFSVIVTPESQQECIDNPIMCGDLSDESIAYYYCEEGLTDDDIIPTYENEEMVVTHKCIGENDHVVVDMDGSVNIEANRVEAYTFGSDYINEGLVKFKSSIRTSVNSPVDFDTVASIFWVEPEEEEIPEETPEETSTSTSSRGRTYYAPVIEESESLPWYSIITGDVISVGSHASDNKLAYIIGSISILGLLGYAFRKW